MKRICGLSVLIFPVLVIVPSCCHTGSRESPTETAPSPTPRMQLEALQKLPERDLYYRDKADPEDADE